MAALKIYLCIIHNNKIIDISVHHDLRTIRSLWINVKNEQKVGLIHIGFVRPKLAKLTRLIDYKNKVLATASTKWALPSGYPCSKASVGEIHIGEQTLPIHLLLDGFGYTESEPKVRSKDVVTDEILNERSISEAALQVLKNSNKPLNKEEIYAYIIEQNLYRFGAQKPVSVLAIELNRHCLGTEYSNAATDPIFGKTNDDEFFALEESKKPLSGWVRKLFSADRLLSSQLSKFGVYDDESYSETAFSLPQFIRDKADIFRFNIKKSSIDVNSFDQLIQIIPESILVADLNSLGLPVRPLKVLKRESITCFGDLESIPIAKMLGWTHFGRKSLKDLCACLLVNTEKMANQISTTNETLARSSPITEGASGTKQEGIESSESVFVSGTPLKTHFEKALASLNERGRKVLECRTGYHGKCLTLEEVAKETQVTRERVRQIQKKIVNNIINTERWDDYIAETISRLLEDRSEPLSLEMLEIEDPWFEGYMENYPHLAAIIELFTDKKIQVFKINNTSVITRIKKEEWNDCIKHFRNSLKDKAKDSEWTRSDVKMTISALLLEKNAEELTPLMWEEFAEKLTFNGEGEDAKLLSYGKTIENIVNAVMHKAESPLHYSEIAKRVEKQIARSFDIRRVQSSMAAIGAKLFARGVYGLEKFNPISPRTSSLIREKVEKILYEGVLNKQWHTNEILKNLKLEFTTLPNELDDYLLNIILSKSNRLVYLNRMIWARSDSNQKPEDRVDMADAFTQILEESGRPLKGNELKHRLSAIRGVAENLQLQPTNRMILIGPDLWGLIERDVGVSSKEVSRRLDVLYEYLAKIQEGIHVSEVDEFMKAQGFNSGNPSSYALLNLAQRDERFYLGRAMFLGLSKWGSDTRRITTSEAVREVLSTMTKPMRIAEIEAKVEDLTRLKVNSHVANILMSEGAIYDHDTRKWSM